MSGHNKWSQIKNKKGATDAKRSKIFSKYARLITLESKKCNGDVNLPTLRSVIEKAKKENMPSDNIERAVKKGKGGEGGEMETIVYEGYGPGGCGVIIVALTENRNKAAAEIKHIFTKNGLALGTPGSASWNFEKTAEGYIPKMTTPLSDEDLEKLGKIVDELEDNDEVQEVYTSAE
ncbi:MAG: YebC/PmpR family DNA-binding transcriptional regulator [Candidatus Parcubacteria bacterium]|nr:YebC/PmpR family DNA-binding transcriptional regulator [Candidatus Parcubacteria bacterium]